MPIPIDCRTKAMCCDDFRGIVISPMLSKVFEHCLLKHLQSFTAFSDNQFGSNKDVGCCHAIYTVRTIVDQWVSRGSTANLCTIDLSKAFDKVNHYAIFIKLMKKHIPDRLLVIIGNSFSGCCTCIRPIRKDRRASIWGGNFALCTYKMYAYVAVWFGSMSVT